MTAGSEADDLAALVARLRRIGTDTASVEVKAAAGGMPRSVRETLSAFGNGDGGRLILGLSEADAFAPAPGFDAGRISDALAGMCADDIDPPVRAPIDILPFEGAVVVIQDVPPVDPMLRPSYVKSRGHYEGSFIRGGDGDRKLTSYEISQLLSSRGQPRDDAVPTDRASVDDLLPEAVDALLARVGRASARAFVGLDPVGALTLLGVLVDDDGTLRPSLAGLLAMGRYPQQFHPQLFVSFVVIPGTEMGEALADGTRFEDNQSFDGPIPEIVANVLKAVRRNMRTAIVITDRGRQDRHDYPVEVIRELLVNALMHRDYGTLARGTQVQVELYADRLVIKSPGGLFGAVVPTQLGVEAVSSTRNAVLAKLLGDIAGEDGQPVCENRASGLTRVMRRLREAGMSPPEFDITPGHVHVTVPRHALLDPATVKWIGSVGIRDLSNVHHLALAMMRSRGSVSNEMLRAWGVETHAATGALRDLVQRGIALKFGGRRYATYELVDPETATAHLFDVIGSDPPKRARRERIDAELDAVVEAIRAGSSSTHAVSETLGLSYQTAARRVSTLLAATRIREINRSRGGGRTFAADAIDAPKAEPAQ